MGKEAGGREGEGNYVLLQKEVIDECPGLEYVSTFHNIFPEARKAPGKKEEAVVELSEKHLKSRKTCHAGTNSHRPNCSIIQHAAEISKSTVNVLFWCLEVVGIQMGNHKL